MQSFRTEYELAGPDNKLVVEKDILDLGRKIAAFKEGTIVEDKFRQLRLARGVYGQRQQGVQMIRIKLPYGRVTAKQLRRIAQVSDEYSTGRLHITTRQDIQIHYVSLDRTPQLWADLEKDDVTLREACGNTVRNVTASVKAGIDPNELFDVTPYAENVYRYFLRKPFGQELGRKIKIAFSATDEDDAFTFIHDFGFIPRIKTETDSDGHLNVVKGFKVLVGGGLGAQPLLAHVAFDFLEANKIIPFIEAAIRVFDRHGERNSRNKARMKYLIAKIGFDAFKQLVNEELNAVQFVEENDFNVIENQIVESCNLKSFSKQDFLTSQADPDFKLWLDTNVFEQKQSGYFAVYAKVLIGDFYTTQARALAQLLEDFDLPELRFTIDQNIQLRFVKAVQLIGIYNLLKEIGLHTSGYNSVVDITACPGTDTCNLGISNSTNVAVVLEEHIRDRFPALLKEAGIKIKISGCMNSCGQHGLAHIGFHGSSIKTKEGTLPALQVLLGGGKTGAGHGRVAEKVIKVPSKRILSVVETLFNDYLQFHDTEEDFNAYFDRQTNNYFYNLLKPLAETENVQAEDYIDWGNEEKFATAIGVGECAGVLVDLVATLFYDADEKVTNAQEALEERRFADAIYHAYSAGIHAAKARLIEHKIRCNTQQGIIQDFDTNLGATYGFTAENTFEAFVMRINKVNPSEEFAKEYVPELIAFTDRVKNEKNKVPLI